MADLAALEERNKQLDLEQRDAERKAAEILKQQEATLKALGATRLEEETPPSPKLTTKKSFCDHSECQQIQKHSWSPLGHVPESAACC